MASALRTGRKTIPIHPVRIIHTKPQPSATPLKKKKPRRRGNPGLSKDEKVMKALRELKRAAYNGDVENIPRLEARLDHLLR